MTPRALGLLLVVAHAGATAGLAQGYRLRFDGRAQSVAFRGVIADSLLAVQVVTGEGGGLITPDGIAVRCLGGTYCYFFRPGPERRGVPISASASLVLWGLGVAGLSVHTTARLITDLGDGTVWPGTEPAGQLLEGYAQYERDWLTVRAGRLLRASRLEALGFDGASARARVPRYDLEATGYAGWGLGLAAAVPFSSPALNPLDEWRPRDRQLVAGGELLWSPGPGEARVEYRREVDPQTDYFVSERAAVSLRAHALGPFRATGGFDYNLAEGHVGSADLTATWITPRLTLNAGARRYRPYFSLWTLWGAFSPVPYHAVHGSAQATATAWLQLRVRGERYWYQDAEASTPLVQVEDKGWRFGAGATAAPNERWTLDAGYHAEFGPGASSRGLDAMVAWRLGPRLSLTGYGGALERPLELRTWDATTRWVGGRGEWRALASGRPGWGLLDDARLWAEITWFNEDRDRPDAAATGFDQLRLRGGVTLMLTSSADRMTLPPATRRRDP